MLRVNYQIVFGEVFGHDKDGKWKVQYHPANCSLGAFIYHYKREDGQKMAQLWNFLNDKEHVRNIMKNCGKLFGDNIDKVKLNVYYKEAESIVKACSQSGYKVECFYKEPKK